MRVRSWPILALASLAHAAVATAQPAQSTVEVQSPEARQLFFTGRSLLEQGQLAEACDAFEKSHRLAPAIATLLNLGLCSSQLGRLASANHYYEAAETLASGVGDQKRASFARTEAAALAPRVGSMTLSVIDAGSSQLQITIDGQPAARAQWGLPVPLDAGDHVIEARAEGKVTWRTKLGTLDGVNRVLTVPPLEAAWPLAASTVPLPVEPQEAPAWVQPSRDEVRTGPNRNLAWIPAGVGVLALAAGAVFAVLAANADADSEPYCSDANVCFPRGEALRSEAHTYASWSTGLVIGGGVALTSAAVLWFALPSDAPRADAAARRSSNLTLRVE